MAANFPNFPAVNDTYSYQGTTWQWDGVKWKVISKLKVISSETPPDASAGDIWFDETTGSFSFLYVDNDSSQWIGFSGPAGLAGSDGSDGIFSSYPKYVTSSHSPYSAVGGEILLVDTSSASVTIVMPATFTSNTAPITIVDNGGTFATNNCLLDGNGNSFYNADGIPDATPFVLDINNLEVTVYGGINLKVR